MRRSPGFLYRLASPLVGLACLGWVWPVLGDTGPRFRLGVVNERPNKPDHAPNRYGPLQAHLAAARITRFEHLSDKDRADLAYWSKVLPDLQ